MKPGPKPRPAAELFWKKVDRRESDEYWLWTAGMGSQGYGQFGGGRRKYGAHRVAWCLENGVDFQALPPTTVIRHTCDNPPCCNPAHLRSGTKADNSRDMVQRGRSTAGERNPRAKLTDDDVREIREATGVSQRRLADRYGVKQGLIGLIIRRKIWRHIP